VKTPDEIISNLDTRMPGVEMSHGTAPYGDHVRLLSDIEGPLVDLTRNALRSTLISSSLDAVDLPGSIRVVSGNPRFVSEIFSILSIRLIYAE
jgi:hypothetical protein